jgi:acetyl esterase/lipase
MYHNKNLVLLLVCCMLAPVCLFAQGSSTGPIHFWSKGAPGSAMDTAAEKDITKPTDARPGDRPVIRLTNISEPTITFYSPPRETNTGAAVIVCPGGGYNILAMDIEGTEICSWLNSLGITAVLLKYRVPSKAGAPRFQAPLQDAQRALGWVRDHADRAGIDTGKIGIMGFSAGAHLSATLSNNYTKRSYEKQDPADGVNCRPNFVILVYPAYLAVKDEGDKLPLELPVTANTPPTFIVQTEDDPVRVENSLHYYLALKKEKVPAEMHLYPAGGHGYGMRKTGVGIAGWPDRLKEWLQANKWIR